MKCSYTITSGDREKVPPVPIPNTEVKLLIVENTWLVTAREDRTLPDNNIKATLKGCFFDFNFCSVLSSRKGRYRQVKEVCVAMRASPNEHCQKTKNAPARVLFFFWQCARSLCNIALRAAQSIFPAGKISSMRKTGVFLMNTAI